MNIELGNIYWLKLNSEYSHPHVVIKNDADEVTVCAITTNNNKINMPGVVFLNAGEGNLEKESIVEVYKTAIVKKEELKDFIGTLSEQRVTEILNGIKFINKSFF